MPFFECENCAKRVEIEKLEVNIPECCGKPMRRADKLPVCELSSTAEHSRLSGNDDACDDGRSGS